MPNVPGVTVIPTENPYDDNHTRHEQKILTLFEGTRGLKSLVQTLDYPRRLRLSVVCPVSPLSK